MNATEKDVLDACDLLAPVFSATDGLDAAVEAMHGALPAALATVSGLVEQVRQIDALLSEYEASESPAPYTSERALYERLREIVPSGAAE